MPDLLQSISHTASVSLAHICNFRRDRDHLCCGQLSGKEEGGERRSASEREREFSFVHPTMLHALLPDPLDGGAWWSNRVTDGGLHHSGGMFDSIESLLRYH